MKACVTGGGGYVGHRLGRALLEAGYDRVLLLDLLPPGGDPLPAAGRLSFARADVRDAKTLEDHFCGAAVVFHLASYGMSGAQQLQRRLVEDVNVGGTAAVLAAAAAAGVPRIVYLSTVNVVYGGQPIEGGDESLPYFPPRHHIDAYSRTKAAAEQAVLAADGTPLPGRPGRRLRTCSVRPAGIYGPGEQRHLPRIVRYLEQGLFSFVIGGPQEGIVDWVHVDNLVQACVLAADGLTAERHHVAAGQAYFIHDDWPGKTSCVNNFVFLEPLVTGLGYPMPRLAVPLVLAYYVAWALELAHAALWPLCDLSCLFLLTRTEVLKSGGSHWFSVAKARRELGYAPVHHDFQPVVQWFLDRGHGRQQRRQRRRGGPGAEQQQRAMPQRRAAAAAALLALLAALLAAAAAAVALLQHAAAAA